MLFSPTLFVINIHYFFQKNLLVKLSNIHFKKFWDFLVIYVRVSYNIHTENPFDLRSVCMLSCSVVSDPLDPMNCSPPGSSVRGISQAEYWSELPFPSPVNSRVHASKNCFHIFSFTTGISDSYYLYKPVQRTVKILAFDITRLSLD